MRLAMSYTVIADPSTDYRVVVARYFYDLAEVREHGTQLEGLGYHWNPSSDEGPRFPHLHVYADREVLGKHLQKFHLPTGPISVETFIRLLIVEFDVTPLRDDWQALLNGTDNSFL